MIDTIYDYEPPVSALLTLGDPRRQVHEVDYRNLGLTKEDVSELIRMLQDEDLHWADSDSAEVWAPLHAWRALGALQAEAAVEPLVAILHRVDDDDDEWIIEEMPEVFAQIGTAAIPPLALFLANHDRGLWARVTAGSSLAKIGQAHPEARLTCIAALTDTLKEFNTQDETLNGFIISDLVDLQAVEAASLIEQAFQADKVDISIQGDWEDTQIALGLLDERVTPRPHYVGLPSSEIDEMEQRKAELKAEQRRQRQAKSKDKAKRKQAKQSRKRQRKKKK